MAKFEEKVMTITIVNVYAGKKEWRRGWDLKIPENAVSTTYSAMDGM